MRGLVRLLMMFGPMIINQYQRYQRNKDRQLHRQSSDRHISRESHSRREHTSRHHTDRQQSNERHAEYEELKPDIVAKQAEEMSPEERNFKLKEEDIMLDEEDLRYLKNDNKAAVAVELNPEELVEDLPVHSETHDLPDAEDLSANPDIPAEKDNASDIDLEDLQDLFGGE